MSTLNREKELAESLRRLATYLESRPGVLRDFERRFDDLDLYSLLGANQSRFAIAYEHLGSPADLSLDDFRLLLSVLPLRDH